MERSSKKQTKSERAPKPKNIVFFHPDLGIGGAERLVVDAAVGLQNIGHKVTVFTSHCDPAHCFEEARDGTLDVRVRGDWLFPATFFGRFKILASILRQIHLIYAITKGDELEKLQPSVFFVDQLSVGIPFLRWHRENTKILFYCHFPDLLLVQGRKRWHRRIWRICFDWLEGWGIRGADRVVVNSGFTKGVVEGLWPRLGGERGVGVVYPCVDTRNMTASIGATADKARDQELWKDKKVLLSINRFEQKKNVDLALKAFAGIKPEDREGVRLVLAGGYDTRVQENVTYHKSLESLADSLKLKAATAKNIVSAQAIPSDIEVLFLLSVPDQLKSSLLKTAKLLIYTPSNEHFGIVPLEAMIDGVPVLAANSGGPLETILDPETGWLRSVDRLEQWTEVMRQVLHELPPATLQQMGENGKKRVQEEFSEKKMAARLDEEIEAMVQAPRQQATELGDVALAMVLFSVALAAIGFVIHEGLRTDLPSLAIRPQDVAMGVAIIGVSVTVVVAVTWKLMQNESAFM